MHEHNNDRWSLKYNVHFYFSFFSHGTIISFFSYPLSRTKLVHTSSTIEICLVHKHYLIQTKNLSIWFASFVVEAMARRQKPTNACTSFIDGLIVDIGCPHQKIDGRLSRRWTNDDWGSTSEKLGFEVAEARRRRHHRRASPTPRGRSEDAAPTLPMYATPEKRRLLLQLGCRAPRRSRRKNSRTAEKALLHCCTAYCSWGFEGHSSANGGRWAKLSKGYPRSLWWLWCGEVMSQPPTLSCRWLCEIYDITSMTFDPIPNFTQFLTQFF